LQHESPLLRIEPVLQEARLSRLLRAFIACGITSIQLHGKYTDEEIFMMLTRLDEERANLVLEPISIEEKVQIYKLYRYRWFASPQNSKRFINFSEVPSIVLPKFILKIGKGADLKHLESYRQREVEPYGVVFKEVYYRDPDILYRLLGVQRCIRTWQASDPRKMSREDPREDSFLYLLLEIEKSLQEKISIYRDTMAERSPIRFMFLCFQVIAAVLGLLVLAVAVDKAKNASSSYLALVKFVNTIRSCAALILAYWICREMRNRKPITGHMLYRYRRLLEGCRILVGDIVSFRLDTDDKRSTQLNTEIEKSGFRTGLTMAMNQRASQIKMALPVEDDDNKAPEGNFDQWLNRRVVRGLDNNDQIREDLNAGGRLPPINRPATNARRYKEDVSNEHTVSGFFRQSSRKDA
jgi:hypothetical protein